MKGCTPFNKLYGKIWVSFCLPKRKRIFGEVFFWSQQKGNMSFYKTVLGIFKLTLRLPEWHVFVRQALEILTVFDTLTLKWIFWKTKTFFKKLEYRFIVESTKIGNAKFPYKTVLSTEMDLSQRTEFC